MHTVHDPHASTRSLSAIVCDGIFRQLVFRLGVAGNAEFSGYILGVLYCYMVIGSLG